MSSERFSLDAGFLEHPARPIFHISLRPLARPILGSVLFLHPFAEEMHRSRRMVAAQARRLAECGYHCMLIDLTGCGDGAGEFADARWDIWLEDALFATASLRENNDLPLHLWGLRLGALLACEVSTVAEQVESLLLWQPVLNGEQQIDQFLRLSAAAGAVTGGSGFDRKTLWGYLRNNEALEIAGYELTPELALAVAGRRLRDIPPSCLVRWFEIGGGGPLTPPSANVVNHWEDSGLRVETFAVAGEPFWRNQDTPVNEGLLRRTAEVLA